LWYNRPTMKRKRWLCLLALAIALLAYPFLEPYWLTVREVTFVDPDVPPALSGLRIAFLTDIHHGPYFSLGRVRHMVDRTNQLQPDIILLAGDYVHRDEKYIIPCFTELARLEAPLGKYGVLGNHDHWEDALLTSESMIEAGIEWINNRAVWVERDGQRFKIGGVDDLWEGVQRIEPTVEDVSEDDLVLLVSHNPDYVEQMGTNKIDLVLSGHTHGGQVTLFGRWAPFVPSQYGQTYRSGLVDRGFTRVLISNGIGTITPPVRLFCRPEIVLLRLQRGP